MIAFVLAACGTQTPADHKGPAGDEARKDAPAAAANKLDLSGTIAWTGPVTQQAVFVSVRDPGHPGPPLAAKKLPAGPFPMNFTLGEGDRVQMGPPREIPATVSLVVRLDADGDAMSKDPADPSATVETPATSANLAVTLAQQ